MWESGKHVWAAEIWHRSADPACEWSLPSAYRNESIHLGKSSRIFTLEGVLGTDEQRAVCDWEETVTGLLICRAVCLRHISGFVWNNSVLLCFTYTYVSVCCCGKKNNLYNHFKPQFHFSPLAWKTFFFQSSSVLMHLIVESWTLHDWTSILIFFLHSLRIFKDLVFEQCLFEA